MAELEDLALSRLYLVALHVQMEWSDLGFPLLGLTFSVSRLINAQADGLASRTIRACATEEGISLDSAVSDATSRPCRQIISLSA